MSASAAQGIRLQIIRAVIAGISVATVARELGWSVERVRREVRTGLLEVRRASAPAPAPEEPGVSTS